VLRAAGPFVEIGQLAGADHERMDGGGYLRGGVSHRTVHHHDQSIFGKLGVTTRGAAALYAVEHDLL
jgi:hypothetical protein